MSLSRQDIEDRLMDYLYEELSDDESALFEEELRRHPDLQAEVDSHRRTRSAFARLPQLDMPHLVQANILREARRAAADVGAARQEPAGLLARLAAWLMQPAVATAMIGVLVAAIGLYVADRRMLSNDEVREDLYGPERGPSLTAAEPRSPARADRTTLSEAEPPPADLPVAAPDPAMGAGDFETAVAPVPTPAAELPAPVEAASARVPDMEVAAAEVDRLSDLARDRGLRAGGVDKKAEGKVGSKLDLAAPKKKAAAPWGGDLAADLDTRKPQPAPDVAKEAPRKDAPVAVPQGIASNVEQRAVAPGADDNAVRDGFARFGAKAPATAPPVQAAEKAAVVSPAEEPEAFPQGASSAPLANEVRGPQKQQLQERRAAEVVYGGEDLRNSASAPAATSVGGLADDSWKLATGKAEQPGDAGGAQVEAQAAQIAGGALAQDPSSGYRTESSTLDAREDTAPLGMMRQGDALLAAGDVQGAIAAYEKAAKQDPSLAPLARHKVAQAYRQANRFLDALVSYDGLLKNYPRYQNRAAALREKFEVSMALGRLDVAERALKDMEAVEGVAVEELRQRLYARRVAMEADVKASKAAGAAKGNAAPARAKSMEAAEPAFDEIKPATEAK